MAESLPVLQQTVECNTANDTKEVNINPMTEKSFGMILTEEEAAKKKVELQRIGSRVRLLNHLHIVQTATAHRASTHNTQRQEECTILAMLAYVYVKR